MIAKIGAIVGGQKFQSFITILIVLNAIALGLETNKDIMRVIGPELIFFDQLVLSIFTIEIFVKLINERTSFFKNGWNIFDFITVVGSITDVLVTNLQVKQKFSRIFYYQIMLEFALLILDQ